MTHHNFFDSPSSEGTLSSRFHAAISDTEFLLRAASSYDWDTLHSFCQFLEEIFTLSVPDRILQWQKNRIAAAKLQLTAKDQWGNTALHAACYNRAPARVVRAMLQAASAATPEPLQIHTVLSRDLSTPLLVACATGASLEVIRALLDPPAGLICAGAMVFFADQQGATPLTELAINYELQRKSPSHVRTSLPLDQVQLIRYGNNINHSSGVDALLDSFQAKLEALLQAAWSHCFPSQNMISMVHGWAHVAASCPPVVTRLVLREYPHMISFTDRQGTLPLHLAVSQPHTKSGTDETSRPNALARHAYCVEQLLQAYPSAAGIAVPTRNKKRPKRSPFLQAIAAGCFWHSSTTSNGLANDSSNKGPLQHLWKARPMDLSQVDPVSGLYPVCLAATRYWSPDPIHDDSSQMEIQEHVLQVDTIYNLLRLHPQVLDELVVK